MATPELPPLGLQPANSGVTSNIPTTTFDLLRQEEEQDKQTIGAVDFFAESLRQDTMLWAGSRELDQAGFTEDGTDLPDIDTPEGAEWWAEVPTDLVEELQESAKSLSHGEFLKSQIKQSLQREEELAKAGGWGIPGRLLVAATDPVGISLGLASGGLGYLSKGSRATRIFTNAVAGGVTNASMEAYLGRNDLTKSDGDVVLAGLMGVGLGAVTTPGMSPADAQRTAAGFNRAMDDVIKEDMVTAGVLKPQGKVPQPETLEVPGGFGEDSAGAARVGGDVSTPIGDTGDARAFPTEDTPDMAPAFAAKAGTAKLTFASSLLGTEDTVVTNLMRGLIHDPTGGSVRTGAVNTLSASEGAMVRAKSWAAQFYKGFNPTYDAWAKSQGYGAIKKRAPSIRRDFNKQVTRYLRGEAVEDANVIKFGDQVQASFKSIWDEAQRAGLKGFDGEGATAYVPRYPKSDVFARLSQADSGVGSTTIEKLFAGAFKKATDATDEVAARFAKGYVRRIRRLGAGYDDAEIRLSAATDADYLRGIFEEALGGPGPKVDEAISQITDTLKARAQRGDGGTVSHGRSRAPLDESHSIQLPDGRTLRVADFFEEDVEHVYSRYVRTMSGYTALAKEAGIKSDADWANLKNSVAARLEEIGRTDQTAVVHQNMEAYRKLLVGVSLDSEPSSGLNTTLRVLRDFNFPRVMNSVGFAQISDLLKPWSPKYARLVFSQVPEMRSLFKRMADGSLEDTVANDLENLIGTGTDYLRTNVYTAFDEFGFGAGSDGFVGMAEFGLRSAQRGTQVISGLALINNAMQRTVAKSVFLRFARNAVGKKAAAFDDTELAMLGLTRSEFDTIQDALAKTTKWDGDKVASSGLRQLEPDVRDKLLLVMHREATRIIQENDIAATHRYMHTSIGKTLFQFRSFSITAHSKALLGGLNRRDADTLVSFLMSSFGGGLGWGMQKYLSTVNDPDKRKQQLTYENLAAAMIGRGAYSGLMPTMADTVLPFAGVDPIFGATRSTGGSYNLFSLDGNPTIDLVNSSAKGLMGLTRSMGSGHQFSQQDAKAMQRTMLFNNFIPLQIIMNGWIKSLPKSSKETASKEDGTPIL